MRKCLVGMSLLTMVLLLSGSVAYAQASIHVDLDRNTAGVQDSLAGSPGDLIQGAVVLQNFGLFRNFSIKVFFASDPTGALVPPDGQTNVVIGNGCHPGGGVQNLSNLTATPDGFIAAAIFVAFQDGDATTSCDLFTFDVKVSDSFAGSAITFSFDTSSSSGIGNAGGAGTTLVAAIGHPDSVLTMGPPPDTDTPTNTNTPTNTPGIVDTPTNTNTPTNTVGVPTSTNTPTNTPSTPETPTFTNTPTDTPSTPETPTHTSTATNTPTNTPLTPTVPTDTPTQTPPPPHGFALISVNGFMGVHPAGDVTINHDAFTGNTWPLNAIRDANLTADGRGLYVADMIGHVFLFSLNDNDLPQISQGGGGIIFDPTEDVVVAVRPAGTGADAAYVLTDQGRIVEFGNAPAMPDVTPLLPYRDDSNPLYPGLDYGTRVWESPGPREGLGPIGTISQTGGWNPDAAVDMVATAADGALVMARSGLLHKVGSAQAINFEVAPYFGIDIARRVEFAAPGEVPYAMVLDGLGGIHLAGPAESTLRTNWDANVLRNLAYFGAVVGVVDGHEVYAGIDAANDFVVIPNAANDVGIIMMDGFGGLHYANVPPAFMSAKPIYLGGDPLANLHWMVSLSVILPTPQ